MTYLPFCFADAEYEITPRWQLVWHVSTRITALLENVLSCKSRTDRFPLAKLVFIAMRGREVHRNKLVSRHSIVHNRLIERIRLRLVHTIVGWSNIGIFNSFNVLFLLCFSRTCGVCWNLKFIYIFIVITFKLIWFAVCVCWCVCVCVGGGGGGVLKSIWRPCFVFCFKISVLFCVRILQFCITMSWGRWPIEMYSPIRRHNS